MRKLKFFWVNLGRNEVYEGFYAHNPLTRNMMFFRKDSYSLHSYMRLNDKKSKQLYESN